MKGNKEFLRWSEEWYEKENCSKFSELSSLEKAQYRDGLKDRILLRINALFMVATVWTKSRYFSKREECLEGTVSQFDNLSREEEELYELLLEIKRAKVPIRGKMVSVLGEIELGNWSSVEQEKREKIIKKVEQVCKLSRWQIDDFQMNEIIFKLREPYFYCFYKGLENIWFSYKSLKENYKYEDIVEKFDWEKIIESINCIRKQMEKEDPIPSIEEQLEEALKKDSKYQN